MVNSHRIVEVPSRGSSFFQCSQASRYLPHRFHIDLVFPPFHPLRPSRASARGFADRLDTRAVYTLFFSRRCKDRRKRLCARKHEQEAITMFLPSDEGSSASTSARCFPRYAVSISLCARGTLFIPWHMLGSFGGSHKGNSNVAARRNANLRRIGEGGFMDCLGVRATR